MFILEKDKLSPTWIPPKLVSGADHKSSIFLSLCFTKQIINAPGDTFILSPWQRLPVREVQRSPQEGLGIGSVKQKLRNMELLCNLEQVIQPLCIFPIPNWGLDTLTAF